jgi:hypothetical protein
MAALPIPADSLPIPGGEHYSSWLQKHAAEEHNWRPALACVDSSRDSLQHQIEASRNRRSGQTAAAGRRTEESGAQVRAARPGRTTPGTPRGGGGAGGGRRRDWDGARERTGGRAALGELTGEAATGGEDTGWRRGFSGRLTRGQQPGASSGQWGSNPRRKSPWNRLSQLFRGESEHGKLVHPC